MNETKTTTLQIVDIILRLPGLILLEMLYMNNITLKDLFLLESDHSYIQWNVDILLYILAWLLLLLPQRSLLHMYTCGISFGSLLLSHLALRHLLVNSNVVENKNYFYLVATSNETLKNVEWFYIISREKDIMEKAFTVFFVQFALVLFSCKIVNAEPKALVLFCIPLYPWLTCFFKSAILCEFIALSYLFSSLIIFVYYLKPLNIFSIRWRLKVFWIKVQLIVRIFGWQGVITWAQDEYQVQRLLVTCWTLRYIVQLIANFYKSNDLDKLDQTIFENMDVQILHFSSGLSFTLLLFYTGVQCLTTTINLFGLVCIIKDIVKLQFYLTRCWIFWSLNDHPPDSVTGPLTGFIDGITLLIMTLYTDALNTRVEGRMVLMIYILFTIASSQFQSMFSIVDPILMTLATAHNGSSWKHFRTVALALILLAISGFLSYISFFVLRSTFWVFIVAYNYVNTFSLMLGSLSIYSILMIDYLTLRGWTSLDDVMFYIRGACRAIEFCVTLCMCGYIMMTFYAEMTSFVGIILLAVYTYYCIVQRGGKGWRIWKMRRQAGYKVRSLPLATKATLLAKGDDLCPICYQSMESDVRIMHCKHCFHENCLKKWFYIQDKCPMCYAQFQPVPTDIDSNEQMGKGDHNPDEYVPNRERADG